MALTPIVATALTIGDLPVTGTVTFTVTDSRNRAVSVVAGCKFYGPGGMRAAVTAGVLAAGFAVPDLDVAVPVSPADGALTYQIYIFDRTSGRSFELTGVRGITGSQPWSLDTDSVVSAAPAGIYLADHSTQVVYQVALTGSGDLDLPLAPAGVAGAAYSQSFTDEVTGQFIRLYVDGGMLYTTSAAEAGVSPSATLVVPLSGATRLLSFARGEMRLDNSASSGQVLFADEDGTHFWRLKLASRNLSLDAIDGVGLVPPVYLTDQGTHAVVQLVVDLDQLFPTAAPAGVTGPSAILLTDEDTGVLQLLSVTNGFLRSQLGAPA